MLIQQTNKQRALIGSDRTVFYLIESTIKKYRKYSQQKLKKLVPEMTIDQGLVLGKLIENPEVTLRELAETFHKDIASISRMLDLLEKNEFILRSINKENRRRFKVTITKRGLTSYRTLEPIVKENRKQALKGISKREQEELTRILTKITKNLNL